jgi:4-alpha-glucanotransferase
VAELSGDLAELCRSVGLEISYLGWRGEAVVSHPEAVLALLSALGPGFGFELSGLGDVRAATVALQQQRWRSASPVVVAWGGQGELSVPVQASVDGDWELELHLESGRRERLSGRLYELPASGHTEVDGHTLCRRAITLPIGGELGYHHAQWHVHSPGAHAHAQLSGSCAILAAPERAVPRAGGRPWGVFAPLYGLRSPRSGATGDLTTMRALRQWVAKKGGAYVATLPILAQFLDEAYNISPYGPASRLFWNELYLENEAPAQLPPELRADLAASLAGAGAAERRKLSALPLVDYRSQYAWKRAWLDRVAAACDRSAAVRQAIEQWAAHVPAYDYAMFRAFGEMDGASWHSWNPERKHVGAGGVPFATNLDEAVRAGADRGRVWSHVVGQWMMHQQLAKDAVGGATSTASAGLYLDLPVGVNGDAYEVWRHRELFVTEASVGAPPDALFLGGQEWGLPPVHPAVSRATGHRYLRDCLRHHMQAATMLRIDHVMGLHRLYCVPRGFGAKDGAYLRYPKDELYALVTLESHRQRCAIVGEDLGTVPEDVPPALQRHHIARLFVSQFEMPQVVGKSPKRSPEGVVASFGTHDMATFSGWWHGVDLVDRRALGLIGEVEEVRQLEQRGVERAALLAHVDSAKLAPPHLPDEERAMGGAMVDLARSPAEVMLVTLEDLWLEQAPQNVPGTYHERPNWLRPLSIDAVTLGIEPAQAGEIPAGPPPASLDVIDAVAHVRAQPPAPKG